MSNIKNKLTNIVPWSPRLLASSRETPPGGRSWPSPARPRRWAAEPRRAARDFPSVGRGGGERGCGCGRIGDKRRRRAAARLLDSRDAVGGEGGVARVEGAVQERGVFVRVHIEREENEKTKKRNL